ncbi:MAG: DUF4229 domain-containing protein [Angustibacter sp.]
MTLLRYSLLRMLILFTCLLIIYLVGVREPVWLMLGTAISSVIVSYFALREPRAELARQLAERVQGRLPAVSDELAEDELSAAGDSAARAESQRAEPDQIESDRAVPQQVEPGPADSGPADLGQAQREQPPESAKGQSEA